MLLPSMRFAEKWASYIEELQEVEAGLLSGIMTADALRFLTLHLPLSTHKRLLNIGAGDGTEALCLHQLGYDVTAIVLGEKNEKHARTLCGDKVRIVVCDMHDLDFPVGSFDSVYMNQTFEHSFAPFIFLLELFAVLREGGRIWMSMPKFLEWDDPLAAVAPDINLIGPHHPNMLCPNLFRQYFAKTGFNILYGGEDKNINRDNNYLLERQSLEDVNLRKEVRRALKRRLHTGGYE